jgi:Tol biopolymer transport system component
MKTKKGGRMVRKSILKIITLGVFLVFAGCATIGKYWSIVSVPEESGQVFTKITGKEDLLDTTAPFALSKDGKKIAFTSWKTGNGDIYVKELSGGKAVLQRTSRSEGEFAPCFSPDGKYLAYHAYRDGHYNIYLIGAESGAAIRQITTGSPPDAVYPQFSPDGKRLTFYSLEYAVDNFGKPYLSNTSIWVFEIDTGKLTQHTQGLLPKFTPDGKTIVFKRAKKTGEEKWYGLWKVDLETGAETNILEGEDFGVNHFDISPDGMKLVFSTDKGTKKSATERQNLNLWTVDMDGSNLTQLTFHQSDDQWPCWSPDMKSIYFLSTRSEEDKNIVNIWQVSYQVKP